MKKIILLISIMTSCQVMADEFRGTYTCNLHGVIYESVNKCPSDATYVIGTQNTIGYRSPRFESNELIDSERRKEAKKDNDWNSLSPLGSTPYKNPNTYGNTHFYR